MYGHFQTGLRSDIVTLYQGGKAYGAPNKQYDIDTASRSARTADLDKQVSVAQKGYEDATARAKASATQQLDTAKGYEGRARRLA